MIKLTFGIQADMTSASVIDFNVIGDLSFIESFSSSKIVASTTTGASVTITGSFNFSSESALLNSTISGIIIEDFGGSLIFSIMGIENFTFSSVVNSPDLAIQSLINQVSSGVNIVGSNFSDVLIGYIGNDILKGKDGNDDLKGGAGLDQLYGSNGNDTLNGGKGADQIFGDSGDDLLKGGSGSDRIFGGSGDDLLKGGPGKDTLDGGEGDDIYVVSTGENKADLFKDSGLGISDIDVLDVARVDILPFRAVFNHDKNGIEQINGSPDGTILSGDINPLNWNFSDIQLTNIELRGSLSSDTIIGSTGADVIKGRIGKDWLSGGSGDDTLKGGAGADSLFGEEGDDFLKGGKGRDVLEGDTGHDILTGGPGADDFIFNTIQEADDQITDFDRAEGDQLLLNGGAGTDEFQWGYQSKNATHAHVAGALTGSFLLDTNNFANLTAAVISAADNLFGTTGESAAYFYGFTSVQHHLYYFVANHVSQTGVWSTTLSTHTIATLAGITGAGIGATQIDASDIVLF